jgi:hypothetical protein
MKEKKQSQILVERMFSQSKKYHIIYSFMVAVKKKNSFNSRKQNDYVNSGKKKNIFVHTIKYRDVGESKATLLKFETLHFVKVRNIFHILMRAADSNSSGLRSTNKALDFNPSESKYKRIRSSVSEL